MICSHPWHVEHDSNVSACSLGLPPAYSYAKYRHPLALSIRQEESSGPSDAVESNAETRVPTTQPASAPPRQPRSRRKTPKRHGHFFTTNRFDFANLCCPLDGFAEFLTPGRFKVADHNSAELDNRYIFDYELFRNGLDTGITNGAGSTVRRFDTNRVTVGFEKILGPGKNWSLEMRLPLYSVNDSVFTDGFSNLNPRTGNLIAIAKHRLIENECRTVSAGIGVSIPTGDDSNFIVIDELFTVNNEAVHLQPFIASLWRPSDCWYFHSFVSLDFATTGNRIDYRQLFGGGAAATLGRLTDQSLLNYDCTVGYWWYRCDTRCGLSGLTTAFELNYSTTLNDGDMVTGSTPGNSFRFAPGSRNFDVVGCDAGFGYRVCQKGKFTSGMGRAFANRRRSLFR